MKELRIFAMIGKRRKVGDFMHKFLRSVGFRMCRTKKEEAQLKNNLLKDAVMTERIVIPDDTVYTEYRCELAPGMGISFVGEEGANDTFQCEYYFPYLIGDYKNARFKGMRSEKRMEGCWMNTKWEFHLFFTSTIQWSIVKES